MSTKDKTPVAKAINFTQFFKEEKDIYVQNLSPGQVSMQFGRGDDAMGFTLIRKRDPIILTNHIPFKKIAESMDFRKMLARKPAIIRLLTEEEYQDYYKAQAKAKNVSVDEAIAAAEDTRASFKDKVVQAPTTAPADDETKDEEPVLEEDVVNPRVIHLCRQVATDLKQADRMPLPTLLQELKDIQGELKFDDYEYISAHVAAPTIKKWVIAGQKEIMSKADKTA